MNLALKNVLAAIAFAAFCSPAPAEFFRNTMLS